MAAKHQIMKGDRVRVIRGNYRDMEGSVLEVQRDTGRVRVEGVNMRKRHTRPSRTDAGGILEKEASVHISNVAHIDPKSGEPTRVGIKIIEAKGKGEKPQKVRFARRSGEIIDS